MRAFSVVLLSGALLFVGAAAFAASDTRPIQNEQNISRWVGKPVAQVIDSLGQPTYTSHRNGRLIYDYVVAPQHVGAIETYQFVVSGGKVNATSVVF